MIQLLLAIAALCPQIPGNWDQEPALKCQQWYIKCVDSKEPDVSKYEARDRALTRCVLERKV